MKEIRAENEKKKCSKNKKSSRGGGKLCYFGIAPLPHPPPPHPPKKGGKKADKWVNIE